MLKHPTMTLGWFGSRARRFSVVEVLKIDGGRSDLREVKKTRDWKAPASRLVAGLPACHLSRAGRIWPSVAGFKISPVAARSTMFQAARWESSTTSHLRELNEKGNGTARQEDAAARLLRHAFVVLVLESTAYMCLRAAFEE